MQKLFTLAEAESLLPELARAMRDVCDCKTEHEAMVATLEALTQRIMLEGGVRVDRERIIDTRARRDASAVRLKETLEYIHAFGCLVKDLDLGLIDFPTLFRGKEVLLCWKLGEPAIGYWHGIDEGYRFRKKIDQEFLRYHSATRAR